MTTPDCGPDCEETLREIESFLDGEADDSLRDRISIHLSDCNPCMERAEFRRHVKIMVRSKCTGDLVPPALEQRIRGLLEEPPPAT